MIVEYKVMKGNSFFLPITLASMLLVLFFLLMGAGSGNLIAAERIKFGAVIARSVILDENDQPILVEFDDAGDEVRVVNVPGDYKNDVDSLKILSAADFRFYKNQLEEYKVDHVNNLAIGAILMDRNEFLSQTFVAADNVTSYSYPPGNLPESIKSVFVRGKSNRILPSPQELLLLSFSVDLKNSTSPVSEHDKSLLLSPEGVVIYNSENVIAYRTGFFGNPKEPQRFGFRKDDDEIFGPVSGVKVFVAEFVYPGGVAASGDDGKYSFVFKLPQCPLGGFEFTTDVWAELKYKNFLPTGSPAIPYFIRKQEWSYCFAGLRSPLPLAPPVYTEVDVGATQGHKSDLKVDVMFLTGHAKLINLDGSVVKIGSETTFKAFDEEELPVTQLLYDFNGDGKPDITVKGLRKTIQDDDGNDVNDVFVAENYLSGSEEPNLQGIYYNQEDVPRSSEDILDKQPEFTRLLDFEKRIEGGVSFTDNDLQDNADLAKSAVGVLETISEEDYKNTDILFFRESTGVLVMERRGLRDDEVNGRNSTDFNDDEDSFSYRVMLRGPRDTSINVGGGSRTGGYEQWASDNFLSEPFQKREANHLKPGEFVRVVAINRATGYVGTQRVQLKSAGEFTGQLAVEVDDIEMRPPNLKIWAERDFEVEQGLTAGEDRNFVVGNEGAALTSDTTITIFTEWLDHDGTPLPDGLGADSGEQYGLTGRLAKIVAANTLQAASTAGSNLAEFPIAPGRKIQAVNVKSNLNSAEHYYIHVVGKPKDQECLPGATCPDFSTGNAAPPYDSRPSVFTPFLTPLFDEDNHWQTFNSFLELQRENPNDPSQFTRPLPSYVWQYRPEYQFSQYDLETQALTRVFQEQGAIQGVDILTSAPSTILGSDALLAALYSLVASNYERLSPIDGAQELVLALGEQEHLLTVGEDQTIVFDNIEHLADLEPEDFLSLRLYTNNDAGNILYEYAFDFEERCPIEFSTKISESVFDSAPPTSYLEIGSLNVIPFPKVHSTSSVTAQLLDEDKRHVKNLISKDNVEPGDYTAVILSSDLTGITPFVGNEDFYIVLTVRPNNGKRPRRKLLIGDLKGPSFSGQMLGQVIQHDTLIQRGSLSLRREDMALSGRGPQLNFIRSYTNLRKPENINGPMGDGWSHNHDIFLKVLAYENILPPRTYGDNLPGWVGDTRNGPLGPKLLTSQELADITEDKPQRPSMVSVSNGGNFKRYDSGWSPQRGTHGKLKQVGFQWEYQSKDGTTYLFDPETSNAGRIYVKTIVDRNGNQLDYEYIRLSGQRVVSKITDAVGRTMDFQYGNPDPDPNAAPDTTIPNFFTRPRLKKVTSSVGIDLEFAYHPYILDEPAYKVGMLRSFTRDNYIEQYDYENAPGDSEPNLTSVIDPNGQETRYEYYSFASPPSPFASFGENINYNDVVYRVHYPTLGGDDYAELNYSDRVREITDLRGNTTTYTLNNVGNPIQIDEPLGKTTTMQWTVDLVGQADNVMISKTDESIGATWQYRYDFSGNQILETDPFGSTVEQQWYTDFTVLQSRTDKNGNKFSQNIDANGNVESSTQDATINGITATAVTAHSYNNFGERTSTQDARGNSTLFTYDDWGNLKTITEPEGSITSFVNDNRGRQLSKTDARNELWTNEYDELDRLTLTTDPLNNTMEYVYDNKGNKEQEVHIDTYNVNGVPYERTLTLDYLYGDQRDRVTRVTRSGETLGLANSTVAGSKTYAYDPNSNLVSESDWKAQTTAHQYDELNRKTLTTNRDSDDMATSYQFVANTGLQTTMVDYEGRATVEHKDKLDRVTLINLPQVIDWDGTAHNYQRSFTYDKMDHVESSTDENNNLTQFEYDARYLKTQQINALLDGAVWEYDENGNLVATVDEEGRRTSYQYDRQNRLSNKLQPEGLNWQYAYDFNNNLTSEIDPWGFETSTSYDVVNQPDSRTTPDGTEILAHTNAGQLVFSRDVEGRTNTMLYSVADRLIQQIDGIGRSTTIFYDDNDNVVRTNLAWTGAATGPTSVTTASIYDSLDRLETLTEAEGSLVARSITYEYDKVGNLNKEIRPNGRTTDFVFDELNRQIQITDAEGFSSYLAYDGVGSQTLSRDRRNFDTVTAYDALNRPELITDALNQTLSFQYDKVGNVRFETDKRNTQTEHIYDDLNRLLSSHKRAIANNSPIRLVFNEYDINGFAGHQDQITDANGNSNSMTYNWRGQVIRTDFPGGQGYAASSSFASYDGSGLMSDSTDEIGNVTNYVYFDDGTTQTLTNAENEQTQFTYGLFSQVTTTIKPLGQSYLTTQTHDDLGRLSRIEDADSNATTYIYDANDNLTDQLMPAPSSTGQVQVEYEYDVLNRRITHIQHKASGNLITRYDHDTVGNLTDIIDAKGQVFSNTYDDLNRLDQQNFPAGSDIFTIVTTYDPNNNVDTISESKLAGLEVTDHDYDLLDRLVVSNQRGRSVNYSYDDNGNRINVSSSGGTTNYIFDARNRLATADSSQGLTTYNYLANGWKGTIQYPNGTSADYAYDDVGRVESIINLANDTSVISSFDYLYDDNGNRTQQIEIQNGFVANQQQQTDYSYDFLDRMESYTITDQQSGDVQTTNYTFHGSYDRATELVTNTVAGSTTSSKDRVYNYDETYWVSDIVDNLSAQSIVYDYDDNGNTLSKLDASKSPAVSTVYNYNSRNQLLDAAAGPLGAEVGQGTYDYNYSGMRIRHLNSERGDVEYIYDGNSVLEELNNNANSLIAHYRYADRLLSLNTPTDSQFYLFASLGTTANLSDESGNVEKSYRTDPYGEITHQEGTSVNKQVFTGQEHDEQTGLIYFGARYYDPDTARFITQDTYLGEPGVAPSLHRYPHIQ